MPLLFSQKTSDSNEESLSQKILDYNSNSLKKIQKDYLMIDQIYSEMNNTVFKQSEDILAINPNVKKINNDVEKGNKEFLTFLDTRANILKNQRSILATFLIGALILYLISRI